MAANSCDIYPMLNGEPSKLYMDLLNILDYDRNLTNFIYAAYLQQGVGLQMDGANYPRNNQNQHNALDVYKFFNIDKIIKDHNDYKTIALKRAGAIDSQGNRISYNNGKQALEKAEAFNNSTLGESYVASVYQHENEFQIYVERKDSMSVEEAGIVKEQLKAWNTITQAFNLKHVDLNLLAQTYPNIFSPVRITSMLEWLRNLQAMNPSNINVLSVTDLKIALTFNSNEQVVQRLVQRFNGVDNAANEFYTYLRTGHASPADAARFQGVKNILLNLGGIDMNALVNQVEAESANLRASDNNFLISETIKSFGDKINHNILDDLGKKKKEINSLSEAAVRAVQVLSRKLDDAKNEKDARKIIELEKKRSKLIDQIDGKCYYGGTLELIQNVLTDISDLMQAIQTVPPGTKLEQIISYTNNYSKLNSIIDNYYDIISALADLDKVIINENISKADEQSLQRVAKDALTKLKEVKDIMDSSRFSIVVDILTEYLGDEAINGIPIASLADQALHDTNRLDALFSSTEISNPLVSAVGTIIRRAQQERDKRITEFSNRIQRATNKLEKAGYKNQEWMYEPDGSIISDINWSAYFKARKSYKEQLKAQGYTGFTFDNMLLDWEEQNTEDRIVDKVNNRTERVPNKLYRKPMPILDQAQQEYYDTMMQIKGELGTLLPEYARDHYNPPQIRLGMVDALKDAYKNYKGKGIVKRIVKILKEDFKDLFIWREDDEHVDSNGYYSGGFSSVSSNPNGTIKKRIPIFYRGTLEDPSMLDKNFSYAISQMAATSLNYASLSKIESMVTYMKGFIETKSILDKDAKGNTMADVTEGKRTMVVTRIKNYAYNTSLRGQLEGIVDHQMCGITKYKKTWYSKLILNLIKYTSAAALTVNIKGATANDIIGVIQTMIEAHGGEFYNKKDWLKAQKEVMNPTKWGEVMADNINGTKLSIDTLLNERFNVQQKVYENLKDRHYYMTKMDKIRDSLENTLLYGLGEYHVHQINLKALLQSEKVLLNGKKVPLRDIFDQTTPVNGVSELIIKPGATRLDGSPITEEYLDSIRDIVKLLNQEHHGGMANEDKGTIHRYLFGKAIMNFRQWMVKHFKRRYGKAYKDPLTKREREGFHRTMVLCIIASSLDFMWLRKRLIKLTASTNFANKLENFQGMYAWKNIKAKNDRMRRANVRKAIAEHIIAGILWSMYQWLSGDDDDDKSWLEYQALSTIDRLLLEVWGSTPIGLPKESLKLINKPIPSIDTYNKLFYPITGISDILKEYKTGRYKGDNIWWHNFRYEFLPFYKQINYFINPQDDKSLLMNR